MRTRWAVDFRLFLWMLGAPLADTNPSKRPVAALLGLVVGILLMAGMLGRYATPPDMFWVLAAPMVAWPTVGLARSRDDVCGFFKMMPLSAQAVSRAAILSDAVLFLVPTSMTFVFFRPATVAFAIGLNIAVFLWAERCGTFRSSFAANLWGLLGAAALAGLGIAVPQRTAVMWLACAVLAGVTIFVPPRIGNREEHSTDRAMPSVVRGNRSRLEGLTSLRESRDRRFPLLRAMILAIALATANGDEPVLPTNALRAAVRSTLVRSALIQVPACVIVAAWGFWMGPRRAARHRLRRILAAGLVTMAMFLLGPSMFPMTYPPVWKSTLLWPFMAIALFLCVMTWRAVRRHGLAQ